MNELIEKNSSVEFNQWGHSFCEESGCESRGPYWRMKPAQFACISLWEPEKNGSFQALFKRTAYFDQNVDWRTILCTDESNIVPFFGSKGVAGSLSEHHKTLYWSLSEAWRRCKHHDMGILFLSRWAYVSHTREHGSVCPCQNTSRHHVVSCRRGNAFQMGVPARRRPQKKPVSGQHLRSRPIKLKLWSGPAPNAWSLIPLNTCGLTSKNAVADVKSKKCREIVECCEINPRLKYLLVQRCQKLVGSMQRRCEALLRSRAYTTKY